MQKLFLPAVFSLMVLACSGQTSTSASLSFDPSFMLTATGRTGGSSAEGQTLAVSCNWINSFKIQLHEIFHGKEDGSWIQKVTQLKIMVLDGKKTADAQRWSTLPHELREGRFEDLLSYRKGGQRLQLMSRDGKEGLKEIAFLAGDGEGGLYLQFAGKFTRQDLDQMLSSVRDKDEQ